MVGQPVVVQACHCRYCQRRLGTAFAELAYFPADCLAFLQGALVEYEHRSDETGRWLRHRFCPRCGTTVMITVQISQRIGVHLGTLDDPERLPPQRHIFSRSKRAWVRIPPGSQTFERLPTSAPVPPVDHAPDDRSK
jgi:hypothetical protein